VEKNLAHRYIIIVGGIEISLSIHFHQPCGLGRGKEIDGETCHNILQNKKYCEDEVTG